MVTETNTQNPQVLTPAALAAAPAPVKESKWHSILDHVKAFFGVALKDVEVYTPKAASLADVLFPEYKTAIDADAKILEGAATTIQNTVLMVQQKYSDAAAGDTTNAAKLEDALAVVSPLIVPTLQTLKVPVSATVVDITNKINATVAILKNSQVPVATPSPTGT